jgi:hypothetical protein
MRPYKTQRVPTVSQFEAKLIVWGFTGLAFSAVGLCIYYLTA